MCLPRLLGPPSPTPYLRADPVATGARHVGFVWAGNPDHGNDPRRSLPAGIAAAVLARMQARGLAVVSLQVGPRAGELALAAPELPDFAATARIMAGLDLMVTVDTACAHLAGALGVAAWILLPHAPDWRWQRHRTDSPWYAAARLFRQPRPGDWDAVLVDLGAALAVRYPSQRAA
jgi:ADP-heptose:LPS heptosyltransferase